MQFEFEKAERMLKRADKLIEKVKMKQKLGEKSPPRKGHVKFELPEI